MKATTKAQTEAQQTQRSGAKQTDPKPERQQMGSDSDPSLAESVPMTPRACYAVQRLVTEVESIFPSVETEFVSTNGRGVAVGVRFEHKSQDMGALLSLIVSDERVARVESSPAGRVVTVTMKGWPTTMDDRSSFGLDEAMVILNEDDDSDDGEGDDDGGE